VFHKNNRRVRLPLHSPVKLSGSLLRILIKENFLGKSYIFLSQISAYKKILKIIPTKNNVLD